VEAGVVFSNVEPLAPMSRAGDHRHLENWSSCLTQAPFARKMLLLEKHWGVGRDPVRDWCGLGGLLPHHPCSVTEWR